MGVLDKFLNMMNLGDDEDDYEDDFYEEEEDDYYEEKPSRASKRSLRKKAAEEDDAAYDDLPAESPARELPSARTKSRFSPKVTPMRQARRSSGSGNMEVRVMRPTSYDDSRDIAETLVDNRTVVLNLEGLDLEVAQRIIDFTSGSCYALHGNLQKISQYIFLLTPSNVDISGDMTDILNGSFDIPSVRVDY